MSCFYSNKKKKFGRDENRWAKCWEFVKLAEGTGGFNRISPLCTANFFYDKKSFKKQKLH